MDKATLLTVFPEAFLDKYLAFCASPLRVESEILTDLIAVNRLPLVQQIAFTSKTPKKPSMFMISLGPIIIFDKQANVQRRIGNFLIYLDRQKNDQYWDVEFFLRNVDGCRVVTNSKGHATASFMHPHMSKDFNDDLGFSVAYICISQGRSAIYTAIRLGKLSLAILLISNLLHSLGPDQAFLPIHQWPEEKKE